MIGWGFISLIAAVDPTAHGPGETTAQKPWTEHSTGFIPFLLGSFTLQFIEQSHRCHQNVMTRVGVFEQKGVDQLDCRFVVRLSTEVHGIAGNFEIKTRT